MKKILFIFAIILLVLGIFASQSSAVAPPPPPDGDSLTYQTYSSDNFNFSLEYPEGWYIKDDYENEHCYEGECYPLKTLGLPRKQLVRISSIPPDQVKLSSTSTYRMIEIAVLERKPGFEMHDDHIIGADGSRFEFPAAWWGTWEEEKEEIIPLNKISGNGWSGLERGFESQNLLHIDTVLSAGPESQYIYWIQTIGVRDKENVINIYQHLKETMSVNVTGSRLIRARTGYKVYKIISGKKLWIPSPQAFNRLGLKWGNIQQVASSQLNQYPRLKLAKEAGTDRIWYLTQGGLRRHILTDKVFTSYGNKYEDVVELAPETLSAYPINNLIRLETGYKVYKIEGNTKRWIKTPQAFNKLGYKWENIAPVNETELAAYKPGAPITTEVERLSVKACGVSESLLSENALNKLVVGSDSFDPDYFEKDGALVCLGENLLDNCSKAKAIIKTPNGGPMKYEVKGGSESNCRIKIQYPDAENIPSEDQKEYANKYISCPMDFLEKTFQFQSETEGVPSPEDNPGVYAASTYFVMGFTSWGYTGTSQLSEGGCTGTLVERLSQACGETVEYKGQTYDTVQIGDQCWLAENLNVGTMVNGSQEQTDNGTIEKYCYANENSNCDTYGGLYQWDEAMQYATEEGAPGICPPGWHIPSHNEWTTLERQICSNVGNTRCDATFPKNTETTGWLGEETTTAEGEGSAMAGNESLWIDAYIDNEGEGNNDFGTSDLDVPPGGYRSRVGNFNFETSYAYLWSSSEYDSSTAWRRTLNSTHTGISRDAASKDYGFSIRCVKD